MHIRRLLLTLPAQRGWFHVVQKGLVRQRPASFKEQPDLQERGESQSKARQVKGHSAKPSSAGQPELLQSFFLVPASKMKDGNKIRTRCPYPFQTACQSIHQSQWKIFGFMFVASPVCHVAGHADFTHPMGEVDCGLRPRLHWIFINVVSDETEFAQPLQAWNAVLQHFQRETRIEDALSK